MKRYAVADEVPEESRIWLTANYEYEIISEDSGLAEIIDDGGNDTTICTDSCAWLNGKSWRIVEREG